MTKRKTAPAGDQQPEQVQEPEQAVLDKEQAEAEHAASVEDARQQPTGLQRIATVQGTQLAMYGDRDIMRELVDRLVAFHPAAQDVGVRGMRAVAQLAITLGASPLPGVNEIHVWVQKKRYKDEFNNWNTRETTVVQPGINYHMRRAAMYGGVEWLVPVRPFDEVDYALYGVDFEKEMGAVCIGCRAAEIERKVAQGWDTRDAQQQARMMGLGTVGRDETAKQGRPLIWTAMKRAETDFFRKAFPYIPGEMVPPGPGMRWDDDRQAYVPSYDIHWAALSPQLDEGVRQVEVPESMQGVDANVLLFGDSGDAEPIILDGGGKDRRAAAQYLND